MRQQRKSVCFYGEDEDPNSPTGGTQPLPARGSRRNSSVVVVRSDRSSGDRDALTTAAVLDLIKAQDPWEAPQRREDIVRRLSVASARGDQRRISTLSLDQVVRRRSSAYVSAGPIDARGDGDGRDTLAANSSRNASFKRIASAGSVSGGDPFSPTSEDYDGPRFMSVATRYRLPRKSVSVADDDGRSDARSPNMGALSPKDSARFLGSLRHGRIGSVLSERRPSHMQPLRTSIFLRSDDELRRASQISSARSTTLTPVPPTPSSMRNRRRNLLKKDSVMLASSDSDDEEVPSGADARAFAEKKRNEETMMQQLTSRSLSTVLLATLSQRITGAVRTNSRAPHPPLSLLRKRLALTMLQTFLTNPNTPRAYASAIVITASNIDADWKRTIMKKLIKEKGTRGVLASGDAALSAQIEWVLSVRSQLATAPSSSGGTEHGSALHQTHGSDDSSDDDASAQGERPRPNMLPHLTPVPPHQRNRGSLDERLAGFSFADGLPSNAGKTTGGNGSRNNSATRLFFESESEEDDDDGEASSADSLQADEAHQKAEAEEEDLPLDCLKHVAKPLSSLAETIAFHRGRCGNAASRVEPLVFVGASSAKTPRSFRLGANRGQHAPRVSPVALSLGLFRHGAAERGAVDDTDDAEEAAMGKLHSKPKVAAPITRRDVDGFVANVVCEAAVATELRCIYIHHTPMTFKHIARLTHGALAAMQPRFLKRLALRFCELDGVALAPLLAWLAVDHNGPAALHTLDLADNCISAKDLAVLAVAICGVPTLVHLSIRNNPLSLYYEEAQQRVNDEHREAVRLYNEHRQRKADDWAMLSGTAKWSAMGRGVAARRDSGFAGSFYDDGLPTSATMMMVRSPNIQPPPPPVNPELPPHQLIASFITALNQIEHLDLGFCGLGDTSVVKICNYLHDSDCRIKFLNLDGASMTITVSALLLDTIKRHCRSLLYVSLRYVFFCSGPQFQRKLCHTLRRRVWHALKESGEYDTIKEKEYRRRYRRETRITVGGGGDDGGGGSSGGSSPVPRLSRRTTIQPDGEDASYDDDDDAMECSASSGSDDGIEVGRTGGDAQNNDKNTQDNTTLPSVEIPCVHPPLAHLYHRLRSLERWCDVKLAYRAQASAQRETSQLVSSIGTVGSLGNLSQLRTSASFIGTRKHRRKKESKCTDDAMTPPLGVMQDHDDGCGGGEATASETTRSDDAATPQSSATDPSCHGPLNGQTPPPAAVGTPRPVVRWRLSEDGTDGSSGTPTPRRSVAHTGEGVCDEAGSDGGMGVSFLVSVPQPAAALNRVMSSGSNAGATDQAPVVQQHARAAERKQSLALPLPRERPHWKTFGSAERRSNNDDDDGDDSEYISSEEPTDDDAEVDQDSFAELDVEGDNVDEWGGWNLAGLRRGYGRYTTNSPSLAKRKRRTRGTKPG